MERMEWRDSLLEAWESQVAPDRVSKSHVAGLVRILRAFEHETHVLHHSVAHVPP